MFSSILRYSEYWRGLDKINEYTKTGNWKLKIEIQYDVGNTSQPSARAGTWGVGEWGNFSVGNVGNQFQLTIGSRTAKENMGDGDPFVTLPLNGKYFNTVDVGYPDECGRKRGGGWWFGSDCNNTCLNCKTGSNWYDDTTNTVETLSRSLMWIMRTDDPMNPIR